MYSYRSKKILIAGITMSLIFFILFTIRLGVFQNSVSQSSSPKISTQVITDRDSWMNIFQDGKKIGFSNVRLVKYQDQYQFHETVFMKINTLGISQDITLKTDGIFNSDFSLSSIDVEIVSGVFKFQASAHVSGETLVVTTQNAADQQTLTIPLKNKPYLTAGIMNAVMAADPKPGQTFSYEIFDPATMGQEVVKVHIIGPEPTQLKDTTHHAVKVALEFKGVRQYAWLDESGDILKESGILGITMERTTRDDAMFGLPVQSSEDLTYVASIESNMVLLNPENLNKLTVRISGIDPELLQLDGGRQQFHDSILTIEKETIPTESQSEIPSELYEFLKPTPFIQSEHPSIKELTKTLVSDDDPIDQKATKILKWVNEHIEKRPVLSVPNALSTLENRVGDCNEHAMLVAAMAQAAGIPVQVEVGVVYLKERFYYHAWNSLWLGKWITADALFGQMPADVTHIRFSTEFRQLDLLSAIGKIKLEILEFN